MTRIEEQAQYYKNILLRDRSIKAVVHLEDAEDEHFWNHQLQKASPAKYLFLPYSKSDKGTDARGCEQCLRDRLYFTNCFFICIDSDLRQLKGEDGLNADNYIAQTYTYSWENHLCEAKHLQRRFSALIPECNFDFEVFLTNLSAVIYKPLLYLVHYSQRSELNRQWNISKFNACLPLQPRLEELSDNGRGYIERVSLLFEESLRGLEQPDMMTNEFIDDSNAYLHIQGHQLFKIVLHIGTMLCRGTGVAFKSDILDKAIHTEGYAEINHLQSDLVQITTEA